MRHWKVIHDYDTEKLWFVHREEGTFDDCNPPADSLFFAKLMYCDEYDQEWAKEGKYHLSLMVVAPGAVSESQIKSACNSMGLSQEEWDAADDIQRAIVLMDYGTAAPLWQKQGHNLGKLIKEARKEWVPIIGLSGFYMDKPVNAIGNTAWDFCRGEIGFVRR